MERWEWVAARRSKSLSNQRRQVIELLELRISIVGRDHYEITGSVPIDDAVAVGTGSPGPT